MRPGRQRRQGRSGAKLDRRVSAPQAPRSSEKTTRPITIVRTSIDGELQRAQHHVEGASLVFGQHAVTIAIDLADDRFGDRDARRQRQLELDALLVDADPRRLQQLVTTMR